MDSLPSDYSARNLSAPIDRLPHEAVALVVMHRRNRTVDRNLVKVRTTQPNQLRIGIREQSTLHQRIVGEVDAGHDVADVKGDLFGLGKEVVRDCD